MGRLGSGVGVGSDGFELGSEGMELGSKGFKSGGWGRGGQRSCGVGVGRVWVELKLWRLRARWTLPDVVQSISHTKSGCFSTCSIDSAIFYLFPIFSHVLLFCLSSPPPSWNRQVFPK